jgi:hypothetical protein
MKIVLIQTLMQSSRRLRQRLRFDLSAPSADPATRRKDKTSLILFLFAFALLIGVIALS